MPKKIDDELKARAVHGQGATSEELAEIKALKAEDRRLREDVEILRREPGALHMERSRGGLTHNPSDRSFRLWGDWK